MLFIIKIIKTKKYKNIAYSMNEELGIRKN